MHKVPVLIVKRGTKWIEFFPGVSGIQESQRLLRPRLFFLKAVPLSRSWADWSLSSWDLGRGIRLFQSLFYVVGSPPYNPSPDLESVPRRPSRLDYFPPSVKKERGQDRAFQRPFPCSLTTMEFPTRKTPRVNTFFEILLVKYSMRLRTAWLRRLSDTHTWRSVWGKGMISSTKEVQEWRMTVEP